MFITWISSSINDWDYITHRKNICGDLSDIKNYRPIAIANIISNVFESVLLLKCETYLDTCDNQFGFKADHSTYLCIYMLKEFIDFYKKRNTTVFVTFLDASKTFDRIDQRLQFQKMTIETCSIIYY